MTRFVILEHDHPVRHWDLMLEAGDGLRTWRLDRPPTPGQVVLAEPIADHRKAYLDYEGPVSGGRGRVVRWDAGTCEWIEGPDRIDLYFSGRRLQGPAILEPGPDSRWRFRPLSDS